LNPHDYRAVKMADCTASKRTKGKVGI